LQHQIREQRRLPGKNVWATRLERPTEAPRQSPSRRTAPARERATAVFSAAFFGGARSG
jgi:hypothetical protein